MPHFPLVTQERLRIQTIRPIVAILALTLAGCGVGDFVGAYFNTYYNAQRLFSEAEEEALSQRDPKLPPTDVLTPPAVQQGTKTKFTSVIEKCSKLIQYHPESGFVPSAVTMIGKSYYYQGEYQRAERKFLELFESYPESEDIHHSRLFLARTYYQMKEKEKATALAQEVVAAAVEEDENALAAEASLMLGQIASEANDYASARTYYQKAAELGEATDQRSNALLLVAQMYRQEDKPEEALHAFEGALDASESYITEYQASIGIARTLSLLGSNDAALSLLEDLIANTNFRDKYGEIDLEIANTYAAMNDLTSAIAQYRYVDTTYARTEVAAKSYYRSGLIYETKLMDYDSARVAYSKGKNEFAGAEVTPLLVRRSDYINKYTQFRTELAKYDTMRLKILFPEMFVEDSTKMDSAIAGEQLSPDSVVAPKPKVPLLPIDSVQARLAFYKTEMAGLFYGTIERTDSAEAWYRLLLKDHPTSPDVPRALFTLAQIYAQDTTGDGTRTDSLYDVIIKEYPESEFAYEARRRLGIPFEKKEAGVVSDSYARAEKLMLNGKGKAAIDSFAVIVKEHPLSPVAPRAQYAIGWIYEELQAKPDSAISSYLKLVDLFPASEFALLVKPKLAVVEAERAAKAAADSLGGTQPVPQPDDLEKGEKPLPEDLPLQKGGKPEGDEGEQVKPPSPPAEQPEGIPKPL